MKWEFKRSQLRIEKSCLEMTNKLAPLAVTQNRRNTKVAVWKCSALFRFSIDGRKKCQKMQSEYFADAFATEKRSDWKQTGKCWKS